MHRLQELVRLHRQGVGAREVARVLRMSPNTERRYRKALERAELLHGDVSELPDLDALRSAVGAEPRPQESSSIEAWRELVEAKLRTGAGPRAIYDWLRVNKDDFDGSYWAVKRMCRQLKKARPPAPADVAIRVETKAGQVAQVDFGYVGKLLDPQSGKVRKAWVFVVVLGHSRHLFARVVFDQKAATWLQLHVRAFAFFGGVPEVVVPDNLKAAVIRAAFGMGDSPGLNRSYRELARHYGFCVDPTPPYAPEKKGKVESAVKYVKRSFFGAWSPADIDDANEGLTRWNAEVAGLRQHGTTGQVPLEVFEAEERPALLELPAHPFEPVEWKEAKVHRDAHIQFERRLYSVPWKLMGQQVWVRATPSTVAVYANDVRVATHQRRGEKRVETLPEHLPKGRADLRHRSREHWQHRALVMGQDVHRFVHAVFDSDDVLLQLRAVQGIVTLLEKHPKSRAQAACRRALHFGNLTYAGVRDILRKGLDFEPLPEALPLYGRLDKPTFARSPSEIVH